MKYLQIKNTNNVYIKVVESGLVRKKKKTKPTESNEVQNYYSEIFNFLQQQIVLFLICMLPSRLNGFHRIL